MEAAYRGGIVPAHLFGKAQHKTLQARLSEDIIQRRLESRFFRTDPGYFFLSELRSDPSVPAEFKDTFHARRRTRDLGKHSALALDRNYVLGLDPSRFQSWQSLLKEADAVGALKHTDSRFVRHDLLFVWAFAVVKRDNQVLAYKIGRYRDRRDAFANKKSIGFSDLVGFDDASLFSEDMGVTDCGLSAILTDLDLSKSAFQDQWETARPTVSFTILTPEGVSDPAILFVMEWECPTWFEPTARRLSLNEVRWIDASIAPNDIDAFEPWSATVMTILIEKATQRPHDGQKNTQRSGRTGSI
jgi:hypothetical protein